MSGVAASTTTPPPITDVPRIAAAHQPAQLTPLQNEMIHRAAWKAGVLGAFNLTAKILALRFIVLVAVAGGIMLAFPALAQPDWFRLGILAVYCVGVVFPAAVLAALERK